MIFGKVLFKKDYTGSFRTFKNQYIAFMDFEANNFGSFKIMPSEFFMKSNFGQNLLM